jgi:hypothetical protein
MNQSEERSGIGRLARGVQTFERQVRGLVASSFVFSAVGVVGQVKVFKDDPGFLALSQLVGTLAGAAAVLLTYFRWAQHPVEERSITLNYVPGSHGVHVAVAFVIAAILLLIHYEMARAGWHLSAIPFAAACYAAFYAWTTGALAAATLDRQRELWASMNMDQRINWIRLQQESLTLVKEEKRIRDEIIRISEESRQEEYELQKRLQQDLEKMRQIQKEAERRARRERRIEFWGRASDAILLFRFRHKLQLKTGICLMTVRERARIFEEEQERQEILDRLRAGVTDAGHPDDTNERQHRDG